MAETFGAVAGVVGFGCCTFQIIHSLNAIRLFYTGVKGSPNRIRTLLEDVEVLTSMLQGWDLEFHRADNVRSQRFGSDALRICKRTADDLAAMLLSLHQNMTGKRKHSAFARIHAHLKAQEIDRCLDALERAKSSLSLAYDQCIWMKLQRLEDLQSGSGTEISTLSCPNRTSICQNPKGPCAKEVPRLPELELVIAKPNAVVASQFSLWAFLGGLAYRQYQPLDNADEGGTEGAARSYMIWPSQWLPFKRGLEILSLRASGHPVFLFRSFRVISDQDPIWTACAWGDLDEAQSLISTGQASIFDTTSGGFTLLHIAAVFHQAHIIKWLIDLGLKGDSRGIAAYNHYNNNTTPLMLAASYADRQYWNDTTGFPLGIYGSKDFLADSRPTGQGNVHFLPARPGYILETIRLLVEEGQCDPGAHQNTSGFAERRTYDRYHGPPEGMAFLLQRGRDEFVDFTSLKLWNAAYYGFWSPALTKVLLQHATSTREDESPSQTICAADARHILCCVAVSWLYHQEGSSKTSSWELIRALFENGTHLHESSESFHEYTRDPCLNGDDARFDQTPLYWLAYRIYQAELFDELNGHDPFERRSGLTPQHLYDQWIKALEFAGVDMLDYMIQEEQIHLRNGPFWRRLWYWRDYEIQITLEFQYQDICASQYAIIGSYKYRRGNPSIDRRVAALPGGWKED